MTSTRQRRAAPDHPRQARAARRAGPRAIVYGPFARFADWYHGWRDGRADIPPKPRPGSRPQIVTTPHREALIRWAQGGFAQEHQRLEGQRAGALERKAAAQARQAAAQEALGRAQAGLATVARPLTPGEQRRRRHGEENRPESVVIQRRLREHRREVAAAQARVDRAGHEVARASADLAAATQEAEQLLAAARVRVLRTHEHAHLRLASYRRRLVRAHRHGGWVNTAMGISQPELPHWGEFATAEPARPAQPPPEPESPPGHQHTDPERVTPLGQHSVFGSDPQATFVIPGAAPRHFELTREGGTYRLRDFGHGGGPFIYGKAVKNATLGPGNYFDFGAIRYRISADGTSLDEFPLFPGGECTFIVSGLTAKNKDKARLGGMSFAQRENSLLAILGPSGAGKTSLFSALVGELEPESGELYFQRLPLKTHREQIRAMLGYVPQDDSLFTTTFTVRRLLGYAFQLRAQGNAARRDRRVEEVCEELEITEQIDQLVGTLSGGQRKRVSIAMELLSEPGLLMLDEPTSGLDAGMDREVLKTLRTYAGDGKTVMVITHSTEHLGLAQQVLVVARGGRPVYFGTADDLLGHFQVPNYAELMKALIKDPETAAEAYQASQAAIDAAAEASRVASLPPGESGDIRPRGWVTTCVRQLPVLAHRQAVLLRTRGWTKNPRDREIRHWAQGIAAALAPLIIAAAGAGIAALVGGAAGLGPSHTHQPSSGDAATALSLLVTLCMLSGQALTYGDIINEFPSILREHRTGAVTLAVMVAKWLVFALVAVLQALVITVVYTSLRPGPAYSVALGPGWELWLDLAALSVATMTLGLLISASFQKLEQAVAAITGISIVQIALNGAFSDLSGDRVQNAVAILLPSRWGLSATASSINIRHVSQATFNDAQWHHSVGQWAFDLAMLGLLTAVYFGLATWQLRRRLKAPG
ncbi:MAG TPA: ATP-binding cassette domain-containing protein [Streptosporangiaceae bacterium]|nr:ATP-binding cassette domain-containing protein [Streptosporangiaceae bacterium]